MTPDVKALADGLSEAQRRMVLASEPGAWGRDEDGTGVELRGPNYATARVLSGGALRLGSYTHGSPYGDLYFNNERGLAVRAELARRQKEAPDAQ